MSIVDLSLKQMSLKLPSNGDAGESNAALSGLFLFSIFNTSHECIEHFVDFFVYSSLAKSTYHTSSLFPIVSAPVFFFTCFMCGVVQLLDRWWTLVRSSRRCSPAAASRSEHHSEHYFEHYFYF